jgi:hypothetical protein
MNDSRSPATDHSPMPLRNSLSEKTVQNWRVCMPTPYCRGLSSAEIIGREARFQFGDEDELTTDAAAGDIQAVA